MRTLQYGGVLHPGDFVAISNGNHITFGWYAGDGRGTLQFYYMEGPARTYRDYRAWLTLNDDEKAKNKWMTSRFINGFRLKCLWKSYINSVHKTRVMKVTNPEELFTNKEDREIYEESKEALITLNFIKQ